MQHLKVEPKTTLIAVIIYDGVEMPADVNLTETLPKKGESVDLSADPVLGGEQRLFALPE